MASKVEWPGNNSSLSGILGYRLKNFCEYVVVAIMKSNGGGILKSLTLKNVAEFLEIYSFYTFVVNIQLILGYSNYLPTTLDLT